MTEVRSKPGAGKGVSKRLGPWFLLLTLLLAYHASWSEMVEGDTFATVHQPYALLKFGSLSFDPENFPQMFKWRSKSPLFLSNDFQVQNWTTKVGHRTTAEWRKSGHLELNEPRYFIVKATARPTYVNTFGPLPGLVILPFAALAHSLDTGASTKLLLNLAIGRFTASLLVAGCALLLFRIASQFVTYRQALLVAVSYGLGSCAWAVSSQTIWQQTVNQFLLVLGAYYFLRIPEKPTLAIFSGLAFGTAAASRVTAVIMLGAVIVYLFLHNRRSLPFFVLGLLPAASLMGAYNWYYFGSPFTFAQELVGHTLAAEKTRSPELWQTPFWKGLVGLLVSPSRGLLVFSPILGLSGWGLVRIWRDARFHWLRPLALAVLGMMALQCKWFDWWGGWTYGYRPWLEVTPFLALFIAPVLNSIFALRIGRALFFAFLTWSIFVQAVGALTYDRSWNDRLLYVVQFPDQDLPSAFISEEEAQELAEKQGGNYLGPTRCNIDLTYCNYRLWSVEDNIIAYHLTHFAETRGRRLPVGWTQFSWSPRWRSQN
jgi:hypothetical protein